VTDRLALLASVLASPDDDRPRLVYADWWDENGEPERAEFVRVQVANPDTVSLFETATADTTAWAERPRLQEAEDIHHRHRYEWVPSFNGHSIRGLQGLTEYVHVFRRGFIEEIQFAAADWLAHGDALLAAHPVTTVRLADWPQCWWDWTDREVKIRKAWHPVTGRWEDRADSTLSALRAEWPAVRTWHLPPEPRQGGTLRFGRTALPFDRATFAPPARVLPLTDDVRADVARRVADAVAADARRRSRPPR
jgi:uncharacterized protein (TIGR02996 family)